MTPEPRNANPRARMNGQTPTPRTDANTFNEEGKRPTGEEGEILSVCVEFARQLERELDALRAAIVKHRDNFPDEVLTGEEELWAHVADTPSPDEA